MGVRRPDPFSPFLKSSSSVLYLAGDIKNDKRYTLLKLIRISIRCAII